MHVALLSTDLMLIAAAQGAADRQGIGLTVAANAQAAVASDEPPRLVAIDLRTPGLDILAVVNGLRDSLPAGSMIVASGPHVHRESLAAAHAAGCDEIFTRGQFESRFEELLASLTSTRDKGPS